MVPTCPLVLAIVTAGASPPAGDPPQLAEATSLLWTMPPAGEPVPVATRPPFGAKNSWRWNLMGGFGVDLRDPRNTLGLLGGGVSYFIVDGLSLELEFNVIYYDQHGADAVGFNFNFLGRWHYFRRERLSLYAELGAGIQGTTDKVPGPDSIEPRGGGYFSFTPQAGLGASFEVAPNTRMLAGVRLHHVSNARTRESNPGRNSLMFYVGVSFPF